MLACLKKDAYTIRGYCLYFLFIIVFFSVIPYLSQDPDMAFFAMYPRIFIGMLPLTVYTYDEREHWCSYCLTLPISRRDYVLGKYLLGILLALALTALNALLDLGFGLLGRSGTDLSLGLNLGMSLLMPAVTLPFLFRFGAEKGRIIYLVGVGTGAALSVSLLKTTPMISVSSDTALLLFSLLLYALSAALSVGFYKKREL